MYALSSMAPSFFLDKVNLLRTYLRLKSARLSYDEKEVRGAEKLPNFPLLEILGLGGADFRGILPSDKQMWLVWFV